MKPPTDELNEAQVLAPKLQMIAHAQIVRSALNPRTTFDPAKHAELCLSMKEHGFFADQPLLVRPMNEVQVSMDNEDANEKGFSILERPWGGDDLGWKEVDWTADEEKAARIAYEAYRFEIVKGECRWRAAGEVKIAQVPCVIRQMGDQEALEQALIENLQRTDLSPMEEALGYQRLDQMLADEHPDWQDKQRYEVIRQKIGRGTEMHVRQRLALCLLRGEPAGQAVESKRMSASHGELIARLPSRELRAEVTKKVLSPEFGEDGCMPRSRLRVLMLDFQRELRGASFDPKCATLVPVLEDPQTGERVAGGACTDCPHNTKNRADDSESKGTKFHSCLNPACFEQKESAAYEKWRADMTTDTTSALPAAENKALWDHTGKALAHHSGYVELDESPAAFELKTDVKLPANKGTWFHLIKGRGVPTVLVRDDFGKTHEIVKHDLAVTAAIENKHLIFKEEAKPESKKADSAVDAAADSMLNEQAAEAERIAKDLAGEEEDRVATAQIGAVAVPLEMQKKIPEGLWLALWTSLSQYFLDGISLAAGRRGLASDVFQRQVVKSGDDYVRSAFIEIILQQQCWECEDDNPLLRSLAKLYKVDLKAVSKDAKAALKREREAAAEAAEIEGGMEWKERRDDLTKSEEFRFNDAQVCENPERCELHFPKAAKITASVSTAFLHGSKGAPQWVVGWFVQGPKFGTGEPPRSTETKYGSRALAFRTGLLALAQQLKANNAHEAAQKRVAAWIAKIETPPEPKKKPAKKKGSAK